MKRHLVAALTGLALAVSPVAAATLQASDADEKYNYIAGLFERGFHELVATEGAAFVQKYQSHPRVSLVRYRLGQSLFELSEFQKARAALLPLAAKKFQYEAEVAFRLGQCELELGLDAEAAAHFDAVLATDAEYLESAAAYYSGEAYFRAEQFESAASGYARALRAQPDPDVARASLYGLCWAFHRSGSFADAAQSIELFFGKHPGDAATDELRYLLGECYGNVGEFDKALAAYLQVSDGPQFDDALAGAGFTCAAMEESERAATFFLRLEAAIPQSPLVPEARLHGGLHSYKSGQASTAQAVLDRLLETPPGPFHAEGCYWRGMVERELGGPVAAIAFFERGLDLVEDDAELASRLGLARSDALFDAGRFDEAREAYENMQADSPAVMQSAAIAALNSQDFPRALGLGQQLVGSDESYRLDGLLVVAEAQFGLEKYAEVIQALDAFLAATRQEGHSQRARALSRRAWAHFYLDKFESAGRDFLAIAKQHSGDERAIEASFMAGRAALRGGQTEAASRLLSAHLDAHTQSAFRSDALFDLAQAKRSLGDDAAAEEILATLTANGTGPDASSGGELMLRAKFDRAELLAGRGEHKPASGLFRAVVEGSEADDLRHPALYSLAWSHYELKEWKPARESLVALLSERGLAKELAVPALELLATVERESSNAAGAVIAYNRLRRFDAESDRLPEVALVAGIALKDADRKDEAAALLAEALQAWPQSEPRDRMLYELAFLYRDAKRMDESSATFEQLMTSCPSSPLAIEAAFFRGEEMFAAEDFETAERLYRRASIDGSRVADVALYKSAWCQFRGEQFEDAAATFEEVGKRFPQAAIAPESTFLAGEALYRSDRFDAASKRLEAFLTEHPDHQSRARAQFRLGVCQGELGEFTRCLELLGGLLSRQPDFEHRTEAELWMGRSLLDAERVGEARARFQSVVGADRGVLAARAQLGLGDCSSLEGNWSEALGAYLKVALLYDTDDEVAQATLLAGRCLENMDDQGRAAERYAELIERYPDSSFAAEARQRLAEIRG